MSDLKAATIPEGSDPVEVLALATQAAADKQAAAEAAAALEATRPAPKRPEWASSWVGKIVQFVMDDGSFRPALVVLIDPANSTAELQVFTSVSDILDPAEAGLLAVRRTKVTFSDMDEPGTWHYPPR